MERGKKATVAILIVLGAVGCAREAAEKIDTRPLVRVGAVTNGVAFADTLAVQGMVRAKETASVAARVPGTIDALLVEEGATVKKGTPLFRIDQVNLSNAVMLAKAADVKSQLDYTRLKRLVGEGAVTRDLFEKAEVAAKSTALKLAVAEKNFDDSEVRAPFDGVITKKFKNAGDFCGAGMKVFEMEDSSCYEICVSLNAAHYARVEAEKTEIEVNLSPLPSVLYPLTYKSPSVNPLTRTFEIRAVVEKTPALAAGMLVDAEVVFARRTAQAVPSAAVAKRGGGDCVFKVADGRVVRVPVTAGLSANGCREIVSPVLSPDDKLIVEGMLLVNEGDEVRVK